MTRAARGIRAAHAACRQALRPLLAALLTLAAPLAARSATDTPAAPTAAADPVSNSALDAPLFYQLLIGEIELRAGHLENAYEVLLDAARRQQDENLYQRAVEIALQARAGDQALAAASAWRKARPQSAAPLRYLTQIQLGMNRPQEALEPLAGWLAAVDSAERPALITGVPRLLQRLPDREQALAAGQKLLAPYRQPGVAPAVRGAATVSLGRLQQGAGHPEQALALAQDAQREDATAPGPVMLALDLLPAHAPAEALVQQYLAQPDPEPALVLAYSRLLTQVQRYGDASTLLDRLTRERPALSEPWLTLGALRLELKQGPQAEAALRRYLALTDSEAPPPPAPTDDEDDTPADEEASLKRAAAEATAGGRTQAWLMLSQVAEQRGDTAAAEAWLAKVDNPQRLLEVQSRRASLMARQGQLAQARALIRAVPERTGDDARAKALAEAQLLRDNRRWDEAAQVLATASQRFADDTDLLYEQAMVAEKRDRLDEMETLLRRVIALKPDHPHAHNALGYSLADRGQRLEEARTLIRRALALQPGDPFITDSLGWVEFRLGNRSEAIRLLRQAYQARPDTEIAVHLGEVLWADGQQDEARRLWREARSRDGDNEVLRETLARLKVRL